MIKKKQKKQKHPTHVQIQKRVPGLCVSRWPRRKHRTDQRHKLHRTNHDNFIKLWKTLEDTIRFQSYPAGQVINLTTKKFCKDTFKLLNKNLIFVPTQKTISKDTKKKQFEDFFRQIKFRTISKIRKIKIFLLKKIDSKNQQIKTGYPRTIIIV